MSMLASRAVKTLAIPFDPPHEVTIQKLSGRHLWKADTENDFTAQEYVRKMGGAEFRKQLEEATKGKTAEAVAAVKKDPVHLYDKHTVVKFGLKAWTLTEPDGTLIAITPEVIEDLDPDALEWLAREILRFTKPNLFETEEEAKAAQKETVADSSASGR